MRYVISEFFSLYIFGSVCMGHIKKCISNFWQLTFCKFLRLNTLHLLKLGYKDQVAGTKSRKKKNSIFIEELAVIYTFFVFKGLISLISMNICTS